MKPLLGLSILLACATAPPRLDLDADLPIAETFDPDTDAREWRLQRRYLVGGPTVMPLFVVQRNGIGRYDIDEPFEAFSIDVTAFDFGAGHPQGPGASGFIFRLHAKDRNWHFLREREIVVWLDDSDRMLLGEGEYVDAGLFTRGESTDLATFYEETLARPIWREQLDRIARADLVEVEVAGFRLKLHPATLEGLQRLLATVPARIR